MRSSQRTLWPSTFDSDVMERSIADNSLGHHNENSMMKISTQEMTTADWIAQVTMQLRRSKRCRNKRRLSWILSFLDKRDQSLATARYVIFFL
jgi:hypothetical protein